jgi:hypothetical protein
MTEGVQYPYALAHGRLVAARDAAKGVRYNCPGCLEWVVARARNGRWHFAHDTATDRCNSGFALHETAKRFVTSGMRSALDGETPSYAISRSCEDCGKGVSALLVGKATDVNVHLGQPVFAEMYSDIVLRQNERVIAILEVVVTRPLGEREAQEYEHSDIPVFVTHVDDIESARALQRSFDANTVINVPERRCQRCQELSEDAAKRVATATSRPEAKASLSKKPSSRRRQTRQQGRKLSSLPFNPWIKDRFERMVLNPNTRAEIYANAMVLAEIGFQQSVSKPWLFLMRRKYGVVFASFGSTSDVPIWLNTAAVLHHDLACDETQAKEVLEEVRNYCRQSGAAVRLDDEDMPDNCAEAKARVDQSVLSRLVRLSNRQYHRDQAAKPDATA